MRTRNLLFRTTLAALALTTMGVAASGCATRIPRAITNTQNEGVVLLRTQDDSFNLFWATSAQRYWRCTEEGDALVCRRDCDTKNSDLVCPSFIATYLY